jgi:hypothetical protein
VGFDPDIDFAGRAACRIARVKVDQIFDENSGVQYELPEMKETEQLEVEEEDTVEEGMTTRGQVARRVMEEKRKLTVMNISESKDSAACGGADGESGKEAADGSGGTNGHEGEGEGE